MATAVARAPQMPGRSSTPPPHLKLNTSSRGTPAAVPNKHIPYCSPGPNPSRGLDTPPATPPSKLATSCVEAITAIYPPDRFRKILDEPPVYAINADKLVEALEETSSQPLPDPKQVFPWLHGLHAENQIQLAFFLARRKSQRKIPKCLRGITIVKAGGDLGNSKLKGAITPEEILNCQVAADLGAFLECDPKDGFSVRNFQIQACKMAMVSDLIVYGDESTPAEEILSLARRLAHAQQLWKDKQEILGNEVQSFNTFVVTDPFSIFEQRYSDLVAVDSKGCMTGNVVDFFYFERLEMCLMSLSSEISSNVYLGPTPDPSLDPRANGDLSFDVSIETSDVANLPDTRTLKQFSQILEEPSHTPLNIEFPSSGSIMPPTWSQRDVDGLMDMVRWIYQITNPDDVNDKSSDRDSDVDSVMTSSSSSIKPQKVLIHCTDGYTESSLLGLAYFMYAEGLPVHEAWIRLHRERGRNFFAYPSDVALLTSIQHRILQESPRWQGSILDIAEPRWLTRIDGSLPSRILPYMYLGNLGHANNPELLKELGITRILSVGEPVSWSREINSKWDPDNLLYIDRVQDNGVDPLTEEFDRCLRFIECGKLDGGATLVHCRVGVSRSATICIAEVMNELGLSFPRAYCFVRARRLNVIIQPHLRFTYELLKWEEYQRQKRNEPVRRELEWATIAREIALMNKPYSKQ